MNVRAKMVSASFWSVAGVLVNQVFSFFVLAVLAHHLSPADFGVVALASIFIDLSRGVMLAGLPDALVRQKTWDDRLASSAFWANIFAAGALVLLTCVAAFVLVTFGQRLLGFVFFGLAPSFLIDGLSATPEALFRHHFRFKALAARQVAANFLGGLAAVAAVQLGAGLWALVVQRIVTAVIQAAILWLAVRWKPQLVFSTTLLRPVVLFSIHLMGASLLGQLNTRVVEFVIGLVMGPAALGVYQIAGRGLRVLVQITITPAERVALTAFSKLPTEVAIGKAYVRVTKTTALLSFPVFLITAVVAPEFITLCFGAKWAAASPVMVVLALAVTPATLNYFLSSALSAAGRSNLVFAFAAATTISSAAMSLVAAPFGLIWVAAIGVWLRSHLTQLIAFWALRRGLGLSVKQILSGLSEPALCSSLMAVVLVAVRHFWMQGWSPWERLTVLPPTGMILYGLLLFLLARPRLVESAVELGPLLPKGLVRRIQVPNP